MNGDGACEIENGCASCQDDAWERGVPAPSVGPKNYPDPDVVGCGWKLVRRYQEFVTTHQAHPTNDEMRGFFPYGNYEDDAHAKSGHFSMKFDDLDFDEILFSTSEGRYWGIVKKELFFKRQGAMEKYQSNCKTGNCPTTTADKLNYQMLNWEKSHVKNSAYESMFYWAGARQCRNNFVAVKHFWVGNTCDESGITGCKGK